MVIAFQKDGNKRPCHSGSSQTNLVFFVGKKKKNLICHQFKKNFCVGVVSNLWKFASTVRMLSI